jgi:hypothetical protein
MTDEQRHMAETVYNVYSQKGLPTQGRDSMVDTTQILKEVDAELERLTKLRAALIEASGKSVTSVSKKSRISESGRLVIAMAAKLRHAKRSGDKALVKNLTAKLEAAKTAKAKEAKK